MRTMAKKIFWVMLLLPALLLMPQGVLAEQQPKGSQPGKVTQEKPPEVPNLAELIPLATKLSNRLAAIEKEIAPGLDQTAIEKGLLGLEAKFKEHTRQLERLKRSATYQHNKLMAIKDLTRFDAEALAELTEPLTEAIRELVTARKKWLVERKRWDDWQSIILKDEVLDEVKATFARAQNTIDSALGLINQQLQPKLAILQKAGDLESRINALTTQVNGLILAKRRAFLPDTRTPMFSARYFSQISNLAWFQLERGSQVIVLLSHEFFKAYSWLVILQLLIALAVTIIIFGHRRRLMESERWRFIAKRPIAAGLFIGIVVFYPVFAASPAAFLLVQGVVGGIAGVRLLSGLVAESWKMLLLYALLSFLILMRFFYVIDLPQPLFRLYILLVALVGLGLCVWRAVVSARGDSPLITWAFRLGCLMFGAVLLAELGGYGRFAEYLMKASLRTVGLTIMAWLVIYLARGGVEGLVHSALLQKVTLVRDNTEVVIRRSARFIEVLIGGIALAFILMVWSGYDNPVEAMKGLLSLGFTVGSSKITIGLLLTAAAFLYGSFVLSWVVQSLLMQDVSVEQKMGRGVQQSVATLVHYVIVFLGFLVALLALGFDLTQVTIVLSALGVGIGFGLQQIVNNLVCGIILLVERPVRIGDYIVMGGQWAEVKKIGLRATVVQTFDRADIVVPNADLITHQVVNWTYSDRFARIHIPVGVAYGSDVALVKKILHEIADGTPAVAQYPAPFVFFKGFGDSSLDFELQVHLPDLDNWFTVQGKLCEEIERRFREAGVEIPFPQQDLHLRSVDQPVTATPVFPVDQHLRVVPDPQQDQKGQEDQKDEKVKEDQKDEKVKEDQKDEKVKEDQKDEKDQKTQQDPKDQEDKEKE